MNEPTRDLTTSKRRRLKGDIIKRRLFSIPFTDLPTLSRLSFAAKIPEAKVLSRALSPLDRLLTDSMDEDAISSFQGKVALYKSPLTASSYGDF